jgi:protein TonB
MNTGYRYVIAGAAAVVVTLFTFYFMNLLISGGGDEPNNSDRPPTINFADVEIPDDPTTKQRKKPPPPPPPKEPPPPPKMQIDQPDQVTANLDLDMPSLDVPMGGTGGPFLGTFRRPDPNEEGDIIPLVRIQPQFPREAAIRRIEGWVKVEFTITPAGTVSSPRVIDADPPRVFDREAIRAILKWKFKPRVIDGQAVERRATQTIDFKLAEN